MALLPGLLNMVLGCIAISDRKLGVTYNNDYLFCAKREREREEGGSGEHLLLI